MVNTIDELRLIKQPKNGQIVKVLSHNQNGFKQRFGGGEFIFVAEPLFTINRIKQNRGFSFIQSTPLTQALGADVSYGQKIVFANSGEVGEVFKNASISQGDYLKRVYLKGSDTFRVLNLTSKTKANDQAFFADDDGVYIRPNYEGFDGVGYWKRILGDRQVVTPEMFGAIPNPTIYDYENDSTKALQNAFNSFFPLEAFNKYYVTEKLRVQIKKTYTFFGYDEMYDVKVDRRFRAVDIHTKSVIYTDKNIDIVDLLADCNFKATFDVSQAPMYSKTVVSMPLAFRHRSNIDIVVQGNIKEIVDNPGSTGAICFQFDGLNTEYSDVEFAGNGYVTSTNIKVKGVGVHTLVEHTKIAENLGSGIFTNTTNIVIEGIYVKRGVWCEFPLDGTSFTGVIQSKANCSAYTLEERKQQGFQDFANKIWSKNGMYGIQVWDYRGNENTFTDPCWLVGGPVDLHFNTKREIYRPTKGEHFIRNEVSLISPTSYSPAYGYLDRDSSISKFQLNSILNSVWVNYAQKANVSMKVYTAPKGFNFAQAINSADTYSEITKTNNIKIENAENFGTISKLPPTFKWLKDADVDNDFIEIVLTDPNNTGLLSIRELALSLDGSAKYIQLIQGDRNEGLIDAKDLQYHHFRFLKSVNQPIIIRLIGKGYNRANRSDRKGIIKLADICAYSIDNNELGRNRKYTPVLTTEGGQRVYDDLTFEYGSPIIKKNGNYYKLTMDENGNAIFVKQ